MVTIHLNAILKASGELEYQLPDELPEDDFELVLHVARNPVWTQEEIAELMRPEPKTGAEIATAPEIGAWAELGIAELGIEDSVAWVEIQRNRYRQATW